MPCKFPEHHKSSGGGSGVIGAVLLFAVAVAVVKLVAVAVQFVTTHVAWFIGPPAAAAAVVVGYSLIRTAPRSSAAIRNYPRAIWAGLRWRWLTRNLGLAYLDRHRRRLLRLRLPRTTAARVEREGPHKLRYPRAHIRPDAYGLVATVRTIPNTGRAEIEAHAQHIADAWGCARVQVAQRKPGRLTVRGLRLDPLTLPLPQTGFHAETLFRPYIGRDEWGADRHLDLSGITGITVGGLPGYGKTSLVLSLLGQLAGSAAVQFVFIDLKGGADYADYSKRAWLSVGDDLAATADAISDVHALMRKRLAVIGDDGPRNRWHVGPTEAWPWIVTVIDECHGAFDLEAVKGDKQAEGYVRTCRSLTGQLVKKGRSALFLTLLLTQKQTSDAIPTAIRDICGAGFSFATRTVDAAVAGLGEQIRAYPSYCPTKLQDRPGYIGVATASLPTGGDPFVRLRVPEVTEEAAAERARLTASLRCDPTGTIQVPAPEAVRLPVPAVV